eukprot:4129300-Pyramimonas_sp.AAC.1
MRDRRGLRGILQRAVPGRPAERGRQVHGRRGALQAVPGQAAGCAAAGCPRCEGTVSYTHLRAHETGAYL